jgi:hypothetical protein
MDTLHSLIRSLNKEEIRFYKLYAQRYASGADGLGSRLLDLMRKEAEDAEEDSIFKKLYGETGDKNTYYRLKNRLQEDICDTLTLLHFDKDETNHLHRAICVYNILYQKGKYDLAYYFIKKAEKRAQQTENYELLDLIYTNLVKLSNEVIAINPEEYISKQSENAQRLNRVRQIDQVLAALNYRIKVSQNFRKDNESLLKLVDKTVRDFAKDKAINQSRSFQTKIYRVISQAMIQKHNFKDLEPFLLKTYTSFEKNKWFEKSTHDVKLQMLVYMINALFMNRKFEASLEYAKLLGTEIEQYERMHYEKYLFFYYNSLVINYAQTNINQALAALDEFERVNRKRQNSYYEQFIHLNRATLYFDVHKYADAVRSIIKLYVNDHYKNADRNFKLKIEIAEVIMQYEDGDKTTVIKRIKQIKKSYKDLLKEEAYGSDKEILEILQQLADNEERELNAAVVKRIKETIKRVLDTEDQSTQIINYVVWLAPKVGLDPKQLDGKTATKKAK